jgi:hypothetical protein
MTPFLDYKGIEVSGRIVFGLVRAFGPFKALASQILLAEQVGHKATDGTIIVDPKAWYPFGGFQRAFARAGRLLGDSVLHQIGVSVAKCAQWAPNTGDLQAMAVQMDRAYHLNHRKHGRVMWDPATDHIQEGIGHYRCTLRPGGTIEIEATNPHPCSFDKGLILGGMRVLNVMGGIFHEETHPCRKRGHSSCIYVVRVPAASSYRVEECSSGGATEAVHPRSGGHERGQHHRGGEREEDGVIGRLANEVHA